MLTFVLKYGDVIWKIWLNKKQQQGVVLQFLAMSKILLSDIKHKIRQKRIF